MMFLKIPHSISSRKIILVLLLITIGIFLLYLNLSKNNFSNKNSFSDEYPSNKIATILNSVRPPIFPGNVCNILSYGASASVDHKNTSAINSAIDACFQKGGGTVLIPNGKWLTGAITLKSNINLKLENGAELFFSNDFSDYLPPVFSRFQGIEYYGFSPLIYANGAENIAITGKGKLTGNGEPWQKWSESKKSSKEKSALFQMGEDNIPIEKRVFSNIDGGMRPSFINFINCKNISLSDFLITDGPMWTIHMIYSENISMTDLDIETIGPNTDGVVLDSSKNILLENVFFATGDDAIAIKSGTDKDGQRVNKPSENIVIRNCTVEKGHGAVSIGSEMSGGVRDVFVYNCHFSEADSGIRIKSAPSRGGFVENIWAENIQMDNIKDSPLTINMSYSSKFSSETISPSRISDIHFKGIACQKAGSILEISGREESPIERIFIENNKISSKKGISLKNSKGILFNENNFTIENNPAIRIENCEDITLEKGYCREAEDICLQRKGENNNITIE